LKLLELKANIRTTTGNGPARVLRRRGKLPAVLYGPGTEPVLLSIDTDDLELALRKSKISLLLFNLVIQNGGTFNRSVMIKELQTDPVSGNFLHIDFYEIAMDRKIRVKVPVATQGKARGVELGGILQIVRHELEVLCLPHAIPEAIEVDITELDIGDSIHVKDIPLAGDIEIQADVNFTVVTVSSPKAVAEEEISEAEKGAEEAAAEEKVSPEGGVTD